MNPFLDHTKLGCTFLCEPLESTSEGKKIITKANSKEVTIRSKSPKVAAQTNIEIKDKLSIKNSAQSHQWLPHKQVNQTFQEASSSWLP